jgi:glycosyltransferase involved in cell wall biosynthesis
MHNGLVSILIPTYNRAMYLSEAIDSCLVQSYRPLEIVIADNASVDRTMDIVADRVDMKDVRLKYVRNESNIGPVLNWKMAYNNAEGEYVVLLSDDDFFINTHYLNQSVELLKKYPTANMVIGNAALGQRLPGVNCTVPSESFIRGDVFFARFWSGYYRIPIISNVFKKDCISKDFFWTSNECLYSDIELWLKLMLIGDVAIVHEPSIFYRFHSSNIVTSMNDSQLVDNSVFITNVFDFQRKTCGVGDKKILYSLLDRYILFVSSINRSLNTQFLYQQILKRMRKNGYVKFGYWHIVFFGLKPVIEKIGGLHTKFKRRLKRFVGHVKTRGDTK